MPLNAARLALLVRDQPGDLEQITRRVRFDPVLTARLLGVANAASPASGQELTCVEQATQHLGNAGTLAILGMHLPMRSSLGAGAPSSSSETKLWKHSMLCAIATEQLNHFGRTEVLPESFATALLHDLGAMLLARRPGLEANSTGTHAQLGARVARHWGLPERISAGIEHHHAPLGAPDEHTRRLCSQVLLSEALAAEVGECCALEEPTRFTPALAGCLGMSQANFLSLCDDTNRRYQCLLHSIAS